ncbi:MAG: hypothetical protein JO201_02795 [Verrucomicrobia bacterium]|nr:hypothetical protein [Verrucomicrobiota bacterium]
MAYGTATASNRRVASVVFLVVGAVCILVSRILLIGAAFGVSVWWGLGIFLPFGPTIFRLSYPDLAPWSRTFRLVALPCILGYFIFRPAPPNYDKFFKQSSVASAPANHYGLEKISKVITAPTLEKRREANEKEFARLAAWGQSLKLKKRDLLNSDVQGNVFYEGELAQYNEALAKANAEKQTLFGSTQ